MKAFKLLSFFIFISFLTACAQKGKTPTNIKLNLGAAFSGVAANGGIILYGTNGIDEFQLGLADPNQPLTLNLSFGTWRFLSIAWTGAGQKFTGAQRCEDFTQDIQGPDATVNLILTQLKCAAPLFASLATKTAGQFKPVDIYSCLSLANITTFTDTCNMNEAGTGRTLGFSNSIRVVFEGWSSFGAPMPELSTSCISKNSIMDSKFNQQLNLPLEGDIPFIIVGYEDLNCTRPSETYDYDGGLGNLISIDKSIAKSTTGYNSLYLADNFVGAYSTALIDQIPYFMCGTNNDQNCLPVPSYVKFDENYNTYDMVHDFLTTAFGTQDGIETHKMGKPASVTVNGTGWSMLFHRSIPTSSENGIYQIVWTTGGSNTAAWSGTTLTIDVNPSTTTLTQIISAVNSVPASNITAIALSGTTMDGTGLSPVWLDNGEDPMPQDHRQLGLIHETQQIFGVYGAILYRAGYPTCASLSPGVTVDFVHDFDTLSIQISSPTLSQPPFYGDGSASAYDKRMSVYENGVLIAKAEFNCSAYQKSGYAYLKHQNNNFSDTTEVNMFWDTTLPNTAKAELVLYQDHTDPFSANTNYSKMILRLDKTANSAYKSWIVYAWEDPSTPSSVYLRYNLFADASVALKLQTQKFTDTSSSNLDSFAGGSVEEWNIGTRASVTTTTASFSDITGLTPAVDSIIGTTYPKYSMQSLLYGLGYITP